VPSDFPNSDLAPESRLRAGEALLASDKTREALVEFTQLIEQARGRKAGAELVTRAQMGAGVCRIKLGDVDSGLAILRQVAVTANGALGADAQAKIADSFFDRGQFKSAVDEYLRVTMLFGSSSQAPYAQFRIGECSLKLGDTAAANSAFRKVIDGWNGTVWADKARERLNGGRTLVPAGPKKGASPDSHGAEPENPDNAGSGTVIPPAPEKQSSRTFVPPAPRRSTGAATQAASRPEGRKPALALTHRLSTVSKPLAVSE
jgi:tetratricopeptide (TPR) repeat protein